MARKRPSKWLGAIAAVLLESNQPITADEIARQAIGRELVDSNSLGPADSVRSLIRRHIEREGNTLGFVICGTDRLRLYSMAGKPD